MCPEGDLWYFCQKTEIAIEHKGFILKLKWNGNWCSRRLLKWGRCWFHLTWAEQRRNIFHWSRAEQNYKTFAWEALFPVELSRTVTTFLGKSSPAMAALLHWGKLSPPRRQQDCKLLCLLWLCGPLWLLVARIPFHLSCHAYSWLLPQRLHTYVTSISCRHLTFVDCSIWRGDGDYPSPLVVYRVPFCTMDTSQ